MKKSFLCKECREIRRGVRDGKLKYFEASLLDCLGHDILYKECTPGAEDSCNYRKSEAYALDKQKLENEVKQDKQK